MIGRRSGSRRSAAACSAAGIAARVFADTVPDPTVASVDAGVAFLKDGEHDCVVGFGGGSPLDSAKAIALLGKFGGAMADYKAPHVQDAPGLPIIAIPTTAGTGSEATRFTIITDETTDEKMLCPGLAYLPVAALVDYELTFTKPKRLTADTGIDSLVHAIEAYVSKRANPFSDGMALLAMRAIAPNLRRVCSDPMDAPAREAMMLGAMQAGIAFSNSSVALVHGMSRPIGAHFHVPHGLSNAMLLPAVTAWSAPAALHRYGDCARAMGVADEAEGDQAAVARLLDELAALEVRHTGLPWAAARQQVVRADALGQLALRLNARVGDDALAAKIHQLVGALVVGWVRPFAEARDLVVQGYRLGLRTGDLMTACYNATSMILVQIARNASVGEVRDDVDMLQRESGRVLAVNGGDVIRSAGRWCRVLAGELPAPSPASAEAWIAEVFDADFDNQTALTELYLHIYRTHLLVLFGCHAAVRPLPPRARERLHALASPVAVDAFYLHGLVAAARLAVDGAATVTPDERRGALTELAAGNGPRAELLMRRALVPEDRPILRAELETLAWRQHGLRSWLVEAGQRTEAGRVAEPVFEEGGPFAGELEQPDGVAGRGGVEDDVVVGRDGLRIPDQPRELIERRDLNRAGA